MTNSRRNKDDPSLPGKPYLPLSGLEGCAILNGLCSTCARDKIMREGVDYDECDDNETCEIIADSFFGEVVEWREMPDGEVRCLAFVEHTQATPIRDDKTIDMFGDTA